MAQVIWGYSLGSCTTVDIPEGGQPLTVQLAYGGHIVLYMRLDPAAPLERRLFVSRRSTEPIDAAYLYIGTVQLDDDTFHFFEVPSLLADAATANPGGR